VLLVMVFQNLQGNELLVKTSCHLSPGVNCPEKRSSGSHVENSQDISLHDLGQRESFSKLELAKQQCLCHGSVEAVFEE